MIRRKEIFRRTVTNERITLRTTARRSKLLQICPVCEREVEWLSVWVITAIANIDQTALADLVLKGDLDVRIMGGQVLICSESLKRWFAGREQCSKAMKE